VHHHNIPVNIEEVRDGAVDDFSDYADLAFEDVDYDADAVPFDRREGFQSRVHRAKRIRTSSRSRAAIGKGKKTRLMAFADMTTRRASVHAGFAASKRRRTSLAHRLAVQYQPTRYWDDQSAIYDEFETRNLPSHQKIPKQTFKNGERMHLRDMPRISRPYSSFKAARTLTDQTSEQQHKFSVHGQVRSARSARIRRKTAAANEHVFKALQVSFW